MTMNRTAPLRLLLAILLALFALPALAAPPRPKLQAETLYLPIYSEVWHGDTTAKGPPARMPMSALVSIRNTDPLRPFKLTSAHYYNTQGKLLLDYLKAPREVPPLGTLELMVERQEKEGGSGANFLVEWQAEQPINPPLVQAVHMDIQGTRGLVFVTEAVSIHGK